MGGWLGGEGGCGMKAGMALWSPCPLLIPCPPHFHPCTVVIVLPCTMPFLCKAWTFSAAWLQGFFRVFFCYTTENFYVVDIVALPGSRACEAGEEKPEVGQGGCGREWMGRGLLNQTCTYGE